MVKLSITLVSRGIVQILYYKLGHKDPGFSKYNYIVFHFYAIINYEIYINYTNNIRIPFILAVITKNESYGISKTITVLKIRGNKNEKNLNFFPNNSLDYVISNGMLEI